MAKYKSAKRKASRKSSSDTSEKSVPSPVEKKSRNEQTEEGVNCVQYGGRFKGPVGSSSRPTQRA